MANFFPLLIRSPFRWPASDLGERKTLTYKKPILNKKARPIFCALASFNCGSCDMGKIIINASVRIASDEEAYHTAGTKMQCPGTDGFQAFSIGVH